MRRCRCRRDCDVREPLGRDAAPLRLRERPSPAALAACEQTDIAGSPISSNASARLRRSVPATRRPRRAARDPPVRFRPESSESASIATACRLALTELVQLARLDHANDVVTVERASQPGELGRNRSRAGNHEHARRQMRLDVDVNGTLRRALSLRSAPSEIRRCALRRVLPGARCRASTSRRQSRASRRRQER